MGGRVNKLLTNIHHACIGWMIHLTLQLVTSKSLYTTMVLSGRCISAACRLLEKIVFKYINQRYGFPGWKINMSCFTFINSELSLFKLISIWSYLLILDISLYKMPLVLKTVTILFSGQCSRGRPDAYNASVQWAHHNTSCSML